MKEEAIPAPPPPLRAVKLELKGSGFNYTAASLINFIPYEAVTVLTAGAFDAPVQPLNTEALNASVFYKMRNELLGGGPMSTELNPAKETFFRADLLAGGGKLRLLLEPENMDFSTLGVERGQSSHSNFRTLLGKLAAPAFGAAKNAFLLALLAGKPLTPLKLASAEACDLELSRIILATARK